MKKFLKYLIVFILIVLILAILFLFRSIKSKKIHTSVYEPAVDVVLIGGGIMSATLGTYLSELEPDWQIRMYEQLDHVAQESSNGLNNAGHWPLNEVNMSSSL